MNATKIGTTFDSKHNRRIIRIEYKCASALDAPANAIKIWPHSITKKAAAFHDGENNITGIAADGKNNTEDIDAANNDVDENADAEKEMILSIIKTETTVLKTMVKLTKMLKMMIFRNDDAADIDVGK